MTKGKLPNCIKSYKLKSSGLGFALDENEEEHKIKLDIRIQDSLSLPSLLVVIVGVSPVQNDHLQHIFRGYINQAPL